MVVGGVVVSALAAQVANRIIKRFRILIIVAKHSIDLIKLGSIHREQFTQ